METNRRRWRVFGAVVGTKYLGVWEASSKQEAIDKAMESDIASITLCHQCAQDCEDAEVNSDLSTAEEIGTDDSEWGNVEG